MISPSECTEATDEQYRFGTVENLLLLSVLASKGSLSWARALGIFMTDMYCLVDSVSASVSVSGSVRGLGLGLSSSRRQHTKTSC